MAILYQLFVRNLEGRTSCLRFTTAQVSSEDVKGVLTVREGIPEELQRLVTGTRALGRGAVLAAGPDGHFPSCTLLAVLPGGKGGFGSLLRGAATKAGQKKTSNFDACRDMSGRRLRHVNAEKKLKEWKSEAKEREFERTAEDFLKKQKKTEEEDKGLEVELAKFRDESMRAREEIGSAVMDGLMEAAKRSSVAKRKVAAIEIEVKRARRWGPKDLNEDEDEDEEDSDDDCDMGDGSGPSSAEGEARSSHSGRAEAAEQHTTSLAVEPFERPDNMKAKMKGVANASPVPEAVEIILEYPEMPEGSPEDTIDNEVRDKSDEEPAAFDREVEVHGSTAGADPRSLGDDSPSSSNGKELPGVVDFDRYDTSRDLEVLGMDRLKTELQSRGLKCGGSLSERAARLFLLKRTALEKLDKSCFLKPSRKLVPK